MAVQGICQTITVEAGGDLSALQYYAVALDDGLRAIDGGEAVGILQNKPKTGEGASIGVTGHMKFRAGGAITKGDWLRVDSNSTLVTAGSGYQLVGRAWATVTSGSIGTGVLNFATPPYAFSSSFVL
jgi:hypothetical protein